MGPSMLGRPLGRDKVVTRLERVEVQRVEGNALGDGGVCDGVLGAGGVPGAPMSEESSAIAGVRGADRVLRIFASALCLLSGLLRFPLWEASLFLPPFFCGTYLVEAL